MLARAGFLLAVWPLAISFFAHATTLVVPDQYPTIQSAIEAASSGDSVFVQPGTYNESLSWSGKDLVLLADPGLLELTTAGTGRVVEIGAAAADGSALDGLTIRDGRAERGGGLYLGNGARVKLTRCTFTHNRSFSFSWSYGAAIYADSGSTLDIQECAFLSNFASIDPYAGQLGVGGAIATSYATLSITRSSFVQNSTQGFEGGNGGAINISFGRATIELSRFAGNFGNGAAIKSNGCTSIDRCVFVGNSTAYGSGAVLLHPYCPDAPTTSGVVTASITNSLFYHNFGLLEGTLDAGATLIESNTFACNDSYLAASITAYGGIVSHNIIAFDTKAQACTAAASLRSNAMTCMGTTTQTTPAAVET